MSSLQGLGASAGAGGASQQVTAQLGKFLELAKQFIGALPGLSQAATPILNKIAQSLEGKA
jgi:hypothetical protein